MEDIFLNASNLDKLLDEFEEKEASDTKPKKSHAVSKKKQLHQPAVSKPSHSLKNVEEIIPGQASLNTEILEKFKETSNFSSHATNDAANNDKLNNILDQEIPSNEVKDNLLIDFLAPDAASSERPHLATTSNAITELNFLLPIVAQGKSVDNVKGEPAVVSNFDSNQSSCQLDPSGDAFNQTFEPTNSTHKLADGNDKIAARTISPSMTSDLASDKECTSSNTMETEMVSASDTFFSQQAVDISLLNSWSDSSNRVGFDDVQIDDSEFNQFMEEPVQTENSHHIDNNVNGSTKQVLNNSNPNADQDVSAATFSDSSNTCNDKVVSVNLDTNQRNANKNFESSVVRTDLPTNTQPKLQKVFPKNNRAQQTYLQDASDFAAMVSQIEIPEDICITCDNKIPSDEAPSDTVQASEPMTNLNENNGDALLLNVSSNVSPSTNQVADIASASEHFPGSMNSPAADLAVPAASCQLIPINETMTAAVHQGEAQPATLPAMNEERELQRIPSVSPPSYSSVIAGEYHAGTLIEQTPAFAPAATPTSIQEVPEASFEQAIEATEDNTQENASIQTPQTSSAEEARPRLPNVAYQAVIHRPGDVKPHWIPDEERSSCCKCNAKFTFTKRRHHCRACGQIFCSTCCGEKSKLAYMKNAEARVCIDCYTRIVQADAYARLQSANPGALASIPTTSSPSAPISVMRSDNASGGTSTTPKSVRFSDGTKPDHPDVLPATPPPPPVRAPRAGRLSKRTGSSVMPPLIVERSVDGSCTVDNSPELEFVLTLLKTNGNHFVTFALSANLFVLVKIVQYCSTFFYYFLSSGLDSVGHSEVAILLELENDDSTLPMQAFNLYTHLFNAARKGKVVQSNDFLPIEDFITQSENVFGSSDYAGLLFVRRTAQDISKLSPEQTGESVFLGCPTVEYSSTLFALLVRKSEVSWAKLFCSRLLLGLGAKYKQYPFPLVNYHNRLPVCFEVANTILGILCDFRNYKYKVVTVPGLTVFITKGSVIVNIPCNRFVDVTKIMNSSNEHVVALGSDTFFSDADSGAHLVCLQDEAKRTYHSEVLSTSAFQNEDDGCVGAAFVVFNGSLKSGSTQQARCSIVEDGVMIQLLPEKMAALKEALKAVEDFRISCNQSSPVKHISETSEENAGGSSASVLQKSLHQYMEVRWVSEDTKFNIGLSSPIDFQSLEGVVGYNVQGKSEKKGKHQVLRWNQVFFFKSTSDILDMSRLAERVANGCFQALAPHVKLLRDAQQTKIGVRVNIHPDDVGYAVGSRGLPLPDVCLNALDDALIPLTHEASSSLHVEDDPVIFELIFFVLDIRPSWTLVSN